MSSEQKQEPVVTLFVWRYQELIKAEETLQALENAGVDNWDGYQVAMDELKDSALPEPPRNVFNRH